MFLPSAASPEIVGLTMSLTMLFNVPAFKFVAGQMHPMPPVLGTLVPVGTHACDLERRRAGERDGRRRARKTTPLRLREIPRARAVSPRFPADGHR